LKIKRLFLRLFCLLLVFSLLPAANAAPENLPTGAGERRLEGGQRDFLWPVPNRYNLTSCFLDNRDHYSLDIDGEMDDPVIASYAGAVIGIFDSCDHNYSKTENCSCSSGSWGNYVLLEHEYLLADGDTVTLYSRYAHLTQVQVAVGDTVTAGQQIGTVGTTGHSSGTHLDYEILYGGTGPSETYGVDPYINELLELPPQLYTTFDACCQEYVAYVKTFYTTCAHESYDALGNCSSCGTAYNYQDSRQFEQMGHYTAAAGALAMPTPYAGENGEPLPNMERITVSATVTNAFGEVWYELNMGEGRKAYVSQEELTLESYFDSDLQGELTTLRDGQVLPQESHNLEGIVRSAYPLRNLSAYLNGELYATWTGDGEIYALELRNTGINRKLNFAELAAGEYTLTITASDSTGREAVTVITCKFVIEAPVVEPTPDPKPEPEPTPDPKPTPEPEEEITITFMMGTENQVLKLDGGRMLGKLPVPTQPNETLYFVGWFTAQTGGRMVTPFTVVDEDMVLYPRWDTQTYTLKFDDMQVLVARGAFMTELPTPTRDGYRFLGWYMENGEKLTTYAAITGDMQMRSKWEAIRYTVTLDPNGGQVDKDTFMVTFGSAYGDLPKPVREGYMFMGWKLGSRAITESVEVQTPEDHTLVAVWRDENPTTLWGVPVVAMVLVGAMAVFYVMTQRRKRQEI